MDIARLENAASGRVDRVERQRNLQRIVNNGRFLILPWVRVKGLVSVVGLNRRGVVDEMKEPYKKAVATILTLNHAGRPARALPKRWEGAYAGWVSRSCELRNRPIRESTVSSYPEDNMTACDNASAPRPAESETPCMHRNSTRENRETPLPSVGSRTRTAGRRR